MLRRLFEIYTPPPRLNCREWADEFRFLSKESSSLGGKYRSAIAPYQREPMESVTDPTVQSTCLMWASQVGKTEVINNIVGYFIDADPSPILVVQPTVEFAESWSKERLVPMIRDCPCFAGKVKDPRSRDSGNTLLHKTFPGGNIAICGANAPAGLAGRPRRVVLLDEVDRYPASAGTEGDPCLLAERRTESFWNAVILKTSTPTIKRLSRIEAEFLQTDQRRWFCPCPRCQHHQHLQWSQIRWPEGKPEDAYLECEGCKAQLDDADRIRMIRAGEWRPTAPFTGKRGYHLNGIYSPFKAKKGFKSRLHQMVAGFIEAKRGGRQALKTWVNTFLAETFEDETEKIESSELFNRREAYGPQLPAGVMLLTAGVDVQGDRIEIEVDGWGEGEECWGIQYLVLPGNPLQPQVWADLDSFLLETEWTNAAGLKFKIAASFVDSSAFNTEVCRYTKRRFARSVIAIKGSNQPGEPIIAGLSRKNRAKTPVMRLGTDTAKALIFGRLKLEAPGPGYMHWPEGREFGFDENYFSMLTAEEITTEFRRGFPTRKWVKVRDRNEALDCRVYSTAALHYLNVNWSKLRKNLEKRGTPITVEPKSEDVDTTRDTDHDAPDPPQDPAPPQKKITVKPVARKAFVSSWRKF